MHIHEDINVLIEEGEEVMSLAIGRVGKIISIEEGPFPVRIKNRFFTHSSRTTFESGDKVKLFFNKERERWEVINTFEEIEDE